MATYLILNIVFIFVVLAVLKMTGRLYWSRHSTWTLLILIILTAIFDSLLIYLEIVSYNSELILGLKLALAPVEDFMYPLLAVFIIPAVWRTLKNNHDRKN